MDEHIYKSVLIYQARNRYYNAMQRCALEAMTKYTNDFSFRFFNGLALVFDGLRFNEGIREMKQLRKDPVLGMAVVFCLMHMHKRFHIVGKDELFSLDLQLKADRKKINAFSAYYAALFLHLSGKTEKANEFITKALRMAPNDTDILSLKGWSEVMLGNINNQTFALFVHALDENDKNLDAYLGQVQFHQLHGDFDAAIVILNQLSIRFPFLIIPKVEKMKVYLSNWHWDHSTEIANQILMENSNCLEALTMKIIILIVKEGNYVTGANALRYLASSVEIQEHTNGNLLLRLGQLFSVVCGRNADILNETYKFIQKAIKMKESNCEYLTELGYQAILQCRYRDAATHFKNAIKVNDSSIQTLCGLTLCQMLDSGISDQVKQQIEFLSEIQSRTLNPLLLFMTAKLHSQNRSKAMELLGTAVEAHFKNLNNIPYGSEYLRLFNPDFLLQLVHELLSHSPVRGLMSVNITHPILAEQRSNSSLLQASKILESIIKFCPGLVEAVYLQALVQRFGGELNLAALTLKRILQELDPTYSLARLLQVDIYIEQKKYQQAAQSLEIGLSHSFKIRENPMYHLLQGIILKHQLYYEDALRSFCIAMNLCGMKSVKSTNLEGKLSHMIPVSNNPTIINKQKNKTINDSQQLNMTDKLTLYLEVIEIQQKNNQSTEAFKLFEQISSEFSGTSEEGRLMVATADFYLNQGNQAKAIELLKKIPPEELYYAQAKQKLAYIYLNHRKDRLAFCQCFKELATNCANVSSYLLLGDAYMTIQEPDDAIKQYREAIQQNPHDAIYLCNKLGRAYVRAHQYRAAIAYYQEAIVNSKKNPLKVDLAELYMKLKQYQEAEQMILDEINSKFSAAEEFSALQARTRQYLLLARIREKTGQLALSLQSLKEARDNELKMMHQFLLDQRCQSSNEHNRMISRICVQLAENSQAIHDYEQMLHHYKEALIYSPVDITIMAALARIYIHLNRIEDCQDICIQIVKLDPNNESALIMMADLSFRRMDFENAAYHFSQLLLHRPTYWTVLARLIEVMRRSGKLVEAGIFLQRAEESARSNCDVGLRYCKGLYEWHRGNSNTALRLFNFCRRNEEWGQQAVVNMVEICLNPDGDLPSELIVDTATDDQDLKDSRALALRTAERILNEFKPRSDVVETESLNHRLLKNFLLISSKQKQNIEHALHNFTSIVAKNDNIGAIYGMAVSYVILKQSQRAKNQLKRVAKITWNFEEAEYLEKSWLLLADLYNQAGKYELSAELLKRVLQHNKSSTKAYELCGIAFEKDQNYRAALHYFESAWHHCGNAKFNVGYRLALNYMRNKRYADAIDVCQQLLKTHPENLSIKRDILEKCRSNLKL